MDLLSVLKDVDVFHGIPRRNLEQLTHVCREQLYQRGDTIVIENTPSDELYIIVEGAVEILVDPGLLKASNAKVDPAVITTLWPGQTFGEMGLVDRGRRSASARASADGVTVLQAIRRDDLLRLCEADHRFGYLLMRNIAADLAFKIRSTGLVLRERLLWESELGTLQA